MGGTRDVTRDGTRGVFISSIRAAAFVTHRHSSHVFGQSSARSFSSQTRWTRVEISAREITTFSATWLGSKPVRRRANDAGDAAASLHARVPSTCLA